MPGAGGLASKIGTDSLVNGERDGEEMGMVEFRLIYEGGIGLHIWVSVS